MSELHLEYIGIIHRTKQKEYFFNLFIHELGGMIQINQTHPRCLGQEEKHTHYPLHTNAWLGLGRCLRQLIERGWLKIERRRGSRITLARSSAESALLGPVITLEPATRIDLLCSWPRRGRRHLLCSPARRPPPPHTHSPSPVITRARSPGRAASPAHCCAFAFSVQGSCRPALITP